MVGIVIVTHGQLGHTLIETAQIIFNKKPETIIAVSIDLKENVKN